MMKYIIDIPDEHESDFIVETPFGKRFCFPWRITDVAYSLPTHLHVEEYTEPDREAIENEVWEFMKMIVLSPEEGGITWSELMSCMGNCTIDSILKKFSFQEAKAKYDAWKKLKEEIHVGDEVEYECFGSVVRFVVIEIYNKVAYGFKYPFDHENIDDYCTVDKLKKTGRHFDEVEKLLKKMEED